MTEEQYKNLLEELNLKIDSINERISNRDQLLIQLTKEIALLRNDINNSLGDK